jgi:hypothetical protein
MRSKKKKKKRHKGVMWKAARARKKMSHCISAGSIVKKKPVGTSARRSRAAHGI